MVSRNRYSLKEMRPLLPRPRKKPSSFFESFGILFNIVSTSALDNLQDFTYKKERVLQLLLLRMLNGLCFTTHFFLLNLDLGSPSTTDSKKS